MRRAVGTAVSVLATESPAQLVPGDVDGLHTLADRFTTLSTGAALAADTVSDLDAAGWEGQAAEAFRARREQLPDVLHLAHGIFRVVARTLREVATGMRGPSAPNHS